MKRVLKFDLISHGEQLVAVPFGTKPLSVAFQDGILRLWALVEDEERERIALEVRVVQTGSHVDWQDALRRKNFLGTAMNPAGSYVVHVFFQ